jgi:hypothetical protein
MQLRKTCVSRQCQDPADWNAPNGLADFATSQGLAAHIFTKESDKGPDKVLSAFLMVGWTASCSAIRAACMPPLIAPNHHNNTHCPILLTPTDPDNPSQLPTHCSCEPEEMESAVEEHDFAVEEQAESYTSYENMNRDLT